MSTSNIQVARPRAAGVVYKAPASTTQPTDASTALPNAYVSLGYVSEDGIAETVDDTTELLKEMGGKPVLDLKTATSVSYKMTFLETTADVLKAIYGESNVTTDTTDTSVVKSVTLNGAETPTCCFAFDMRLRGSELFRICLPNARVTSVGEINYKAGSAISYEVEITAYPDSSDNFAYKYWN